MSIRKTTTHARLMCGVAAAVIIACAGAAHAQDAPTINIAPQSLAAALYEFGGQTGHQVLFTPDLANAKMTRGVSGATDQQLALAQLLEGTGLSFQRSGDTFLIVRASDPQSGSAAGDGADQGTVAALIVTAQKREEQIQDVPIAISAFTEKSLQEQKIEGGFDLLKAIPNVTFSKNNFTSYNFSIRGIGTKAVSATTDPGVAVSFNNSALLQNRLFEQEYFDIERVEVLRGPQGTLYGRNATAGVVNVITAKPNLQEFSGWVKGEVGNYHAKRLSAMINMPIVQDKLGIRIAGSLTDRQGYDYNTGTKHAINGRDLWSGRVTIQFNPIERLRTNLIWERFNEDDNRSRTGKQLCHRDPGPTIIGNTNVRYSGADQLLLHVNDVRQSLFSQGCKSGSLYNADAFGTPNGLSMPFVSGSSISAIFYGAADTSQGYPIGVIDWTKDPYGGMMQSPDLRVIESIKDPRYIAKADVVQLNMDFDVTPDVTLSSQTVYNKDSTYSSQDYNRFNTVPVFSNTSNWSNPFSTLAPGGIFCDPQLGCSNSIVGYDIAQAKGTQFGQELRLQSDFKGPINFSVGANYTRFKTLVDYYVFYNLVTADAALPPFNFAPYLNENPITTCVDYNGEDKVCPYIDTNPLESINGDGHNYFRSKNPYKLSSSAVFGEVYWNATDALKVTAGLRYTDDRKTFIPVPSQILTAPGLVAGGDVARGYPESPAIKQHWGEWTGRLGVDWKPDLSFTDQTMVYAFYSHGYKGGGANPPSPGFTTESFFQRENEQSPGFGDFDRQYVTNLLTNNGYARFVSQVLAKFDGPMLSLTGVEYGRTFKPEFVNAFEVGVKNTLMDGALVANADAFFYDYKDYQVSQIRDRTAVNENFDSRLWGLEFETLFSPSRDFQMRATLGYLDTSIGKGETSIDIMDRTAGNPDFVVVKPWMQLPSNCIVPVPVVENWLVQNPSITAYQGLCGGSGTLIDRNGWLTGIIRGAGIIDPANIDPVSGLPLLYDPLYYNGQNGTVDTHGGAGIAKDLGGNELPNAPHWTISFGAQYGHDILDGQWRATVRADAYWQSQSWSRVYNDNPYDKLHGWYNLNLSLWFEKPDQDLKIELYAKNILDKTPITDAFLNSDDTSLTTNVFVLDPRLIGLSIRKGF